MTRPSYVRLRRKPVPLASSRASSNASFATARRGIVVECREQGDEIRDIAPRFDLGRHEAGIFQDPVRGTQLFGYEPVIVENERPARAGKIVKRAFRDRLFDARFRKRVEKHEAVHRDAPSRIPAWICSTSRSSARCARPALRWLTKHTTT